ncbi:MAG: nitroreductase family protein [Anaerolineales bacterium]|nr:nitroreductase family protein [Anaerolineales bacterium]
MEFEALVKKRRMVRNFAPQPVDPAALDRVLDAARRGPSAGYTQGQDFVVVTDPETRLAVARLCHQEGYVAAGFDPFVSNAPVLVIPCTTENAYHRRYQEPDKVDDDGQEIEWPVPYWFMDVGCAVMLLLLAVVNEGLAAGFVGSHRLPELKALLDIPAEVSPVGVIPIGHPAPDKRSPSLQRGRRPTREVVHRERW